ncbi:Predicted small lipoprotein YifL [Shewanella morhuae]|nr:Predicted small lipoprotein YifL [Shewanella morhuae]
MLRKMRLFLLLLLGSLFITACGQKGPLYRSPATEVSQPKSVEESKAASEAEEIKTEIRSIEVQKNQQ